MSQTDARPQANPYQSRLRLSDPLLSKSVEIDWLERHVRGRFGIADTPALSVGKQVMFFMPDVVFIQDGIWIGVVGYSDLGIRRQDSRFIETERVPSDARVVDQTWKHPNKKGGPDRRFKDNRQTHPPAWSVHFQSDSGVNKLVEFSRTGASLGFLNNDGSDGKQ